MSNVVIHVSSATELMSALANATGGETISLASGDYGQLKLNQYTKFNVNYASTVTITSEDPSNPATFTGLGLGYTSNLTFDTVKFDYTSASGAAVYTAPFSVSKSSNISFVNSVFDGDNASGLNATADGYGTGVGLSVRDSSNITLQDSTISTFYRGAVFSNSTNLTVSGNEITDIRSDGLNFAQVQGVVIDSNYIHDFRADYDAGDHRDMIQFWTTGTTKASTDITISNNTFDIGDGIYTQTILMGNELVTAGLAGTEMYYQNVTIEGNTIYNDHLHGISVYSANGLTVQDNTVLQAADDANPLQDSSATWVPRINVSANSTNVTVDNNLTASVTGYTNQAGWSVTGNAYVQNSDSQAAGYYESAFVTSSLTAAADGSHNYIALPGSSYAGVGAPATAAAKPIAAALDAEFTVAEGSTGANSKVFDASFTQGAPNGTTYLWDFGDGVTAEGVTASHAYATGGKYTATLTAVAPDGTKSVQTFEVGILGANVLSMAKDGTITGSAYGVDKTLATPGSAGLDLGKGTVLTIATSNIQALRGADNFDLKLGLSADVTGSVGEVFRITNVVFATVNAKGELQVNLTTDKGTFAVTGSGMKINDGSHHDIGISFDNGTLVLSIDGHTAASRAVGGDLLSSAGSVMFGNGWGQANFDGHVTDLALSVDSADYGLAATEVATALAQQAAKAAAAALTPVVTAPVEVAPIEAATPIVTPIVTPVVTPIVTPAISHDFGSMLSSAKAHGAAVADSSSHHVTMGGDADYVSLGRLTDLESSDTLSFSVEFSRDAGQTGNQRLVWDHQKIGLSLSKDGLIVYAGTDAGFKAFGVQGLGLDDTSTHKVSVVIDAASDHLQVVSDGKVVLDVTDVDFQIAGGNQWGWTLGSAWNEDYHGSISDFTVSDLATFHDPSAHVDMGLSLV